MKKAAILILIVTLFIPRQVCFAESSSASYKIQVFIPPVVGLNVSKDQPGVLKDNLAVKMEENLISEQIVMKDGEKIIYKTAVLR